MSRPSIPTELEGQVALVTGATSGLGRRFATLLADCGAQVALAGRRVERLDSTLLYLVSPASECVTGTVIRVDDGQGPR